MVEDINSQIPGTPLESVHEIDQLDKKILQSLLNDSRKSFQELARELDVSGGTIHVRMNKLKEAGIVKGSKLVVDFKKLGMEVTAYVGVNLVTARDYLTVLKKLDDLPEVVEVSYTTGQYNMFMKVVVKGTRELHHFLIDKLQPIDEIRSTETLMALDFPINREVNVAQV